MPHDNANDSNDPLLVTIYSLDADGCCVGTVYRPDACNPKERDTVLTFNALNIMSLYKYQEGTMSYLRNFHGALHDQFLNASRLGPTVVMSGSARQSPAMDLTNMEKRGYHDQVLAASSSMFFELGSSSIRLRNSNQEAAALSYDDASLYDLLCNDDEKVEYRALRQTYGAEIHAELKAAAQTAVNAFIKNHPEHAQLSDQTLKKQDITDLVTKLSDSEKTELSNAFLDNYEGNAIAAAKKEHLSKNLSPNKYKCDIIYFQIQKMAAKFPPPAEIQFNFMDDRKDILDALHSFYSNHPQLIPKNVTLCLHTYADVSMAPMQFKQDIIGTGEYNPDYIERLRGIFQQEHNQYDRYDFEDAADDIVHQQTFASTANNSQKSEDTGVSAPTAPLPPVMANNTPVFFKTPTPDKTPANSNTPPKPQAS